jgi:ribonuclease D
MPYATTKSMRPNSHRTKALYTSPPHYVRTPDELDTALAQLRRSPFVAIDTEFLRERTYYPKFCLLQIANDDYCALVDVLALSTLLPVLDFLDDSARVKVMHAAHQDLEVLALANGAARGLPLKALTGPFFDTQVAAAFLGMPASIGYADLVQRRLNRSLEKGQARTDWSQRPLSAEQLTYAAADVVYLAELYHDLVRSLQSTPRAAWLEDEARRLEDPRLYVTEPAQAWRRLRGLEHLQPAQRAIAKSLTQWRELRAMRKDLPRGWILPDDVLRQIAERSPSTLDELAAVPGVSKNMIDRRGDEWLKLFADARANADQEPPASHFRPSSSQQKAVRKLIDFVRKQSDRLQISPEYLATRRDIEALIYSGVTGAFANGWRFEAFGKQLLELAATERAQLGPPSG